VAGRAQCLVKSLQAMYVRGTVALPKQATNMKTITHSSYTMFIQATLYVHMKKMPRAHGGRFRVIRQPRS
jgi:hypothetical protein